MSKPTQITLLLVALFGLTVPNGLFLHAVLAGGASPSALLSDKLALAFLLDAFLAMLLLAWRYAVQPIGRVRWYWFVVLSLLGGLGFSLPLYWWMNRDGTASRD